MKIRTKLLLALSTLPILLFILIGTGWIQITHLNHASNSLKTNYDLSIAAAKINTDIKNQGIRIRNLVIFTDENAVQKELTSLQVEDEAVRQNISFLESKVTSPEQKELVTSLKEINTDFDVYKNQVIALVSEGKKEEALDLIDESSVSIHEEFFDVTSDITAIFDSNLESSLTTMIKDFQKEIIISSILLAAAIILIISILYKSIWTLSSRLNSMSTIMGDVASGKADLRTKVEVVANDEIDEVAASFNRMAESLEVQIKKEQELTWMKTNIAEITTSLSGTHSLETLGRTLLSKVVPLVESNHAVLYVRNMDEESNDPAYRLISTYAFKERKHVTNIIHPGEGLIGQAILEKSPIILTDVPSDYIRVASGLGEAPPQNLYVLPIDFEGEVKAVLEIASFKPYSETQQRFLEELMNDLGIILESVMSRIQLAKLLEESQTLMEEIQAQSEELQSQQEELRATNEELEEQTQALRQSEEKL
ncbi:MAG TPA: GAF domain-containing protein, partial [Chondromyces sp.]|nr:GAF domain-containing protein [Chondromyces sp.]